MSQLVGRTNRNYIVNCDFLECLCFKDIFWYHNRLETLGGVAIALQCIHTPTQTRLFTLKQMGDDFRLKVKFNTNIKKVPKTHTSHAITKYTVRLTCWRKHEPNGLYVSHEWVVLMGIISTIYGDVRNDFFYHRKKCHFSRLVCEKINNINVNGYKIIHRVSNYVCIHRLIFILWCLKKCHQKMTGNLTQIFSVTKFKSEADICNQWV